MSSRERLWLKPKERYGSQSTHPVTRLHVPLYNGYRAAYATLIRTDIQTNHKWDGHVATSSIVNEATLESIHSGRPHFKEDRRQRSIIG